METGSVSKAKFIVAIFSLIILIVVGLVWFVVSGSKAPVGFGWYLFSFTTGLTMIILPCTLPLAFVIVPLSMGKGARKGLGIALCFGLGVALMLSVYGVIAAIIGKLAIGALGAPLEVVKNWLYVVAGFFAYVFALGELGLVKFRMPSYTGAVPGFIQRRQDYVKALFLGLFLGNVGVGCPHPATPLILTRIADSGNIFYGWLLFFVHAIGRVIPLLLLAFLAIAGVNALSWLMARKDKVERATGWAMVFVAAFIFCLGFFTHDWWVYSGQHTLLESFTGEETFLNKIAQIIGTGNAHHHGIPTGTGLFGFPLWLGNWVLVFLWVVPIWWYYRRKKRIEATLVDPNEKNLEAKMRPVRFWFYTTLSVFLAVMFIWVVPDLFLNHSNHSIQMTGMTMGTTTTTTTTNTNIMPGMNMPGMTMSMPGMTMGPIMLHEEKDIQEGLVIRMSHTPAEVKVNATSTFMFSIKEIAPGSTTAVLASSLQIDHEKLMHVIGVRTDLSGFFHIHPDAASTTKGLFKVAYVFPQAGEYKIWSEIKKDDVNHIFGHDLLTVVGTGTAALSNSARDFRHETFVDGYQVSLVPTTYFAKGIPATFYFDLHSPSGSGVELDNYLGVQMHLAIIKDDLSEFIHTHPGMQTPPTITSFSPFGTIAYAHGNGVGLDFNVTFPKAGDYKMFAQFRPKGINLPPDQSLVASFWITVTEKPPVVSVKPMLILASLILIALLCFLVKRFLNAKKR